MSNMTRLILIRHGESVANRNNVFAGHSNFSLTEKGHTQAELSAEYIVQNYKIDKIYASDLKRAYFTAFPIAKKTENVIIPDEGLREIYAGEWESMPFPEIPQKYPEAFLTWTTDVGHARCPGGESTQELGLRIIKRLAEIGEENDGKTVVIATHATPIRALQTFCEYGDFAQMQKVPWVANASLTELEYSSGEFKLIKVGVTDHLKELVTDLPKDI